MGRLTKINEDACQFCKCWDYCIEEEPCFLYEVYEKLSDYEDLEEQGRLIEQKHGTWEIHDEYYFCANCYSEWKETFTYCPCCGSKNGEAETDLLKELKV